MLAHDYYSHVFGPAEDVNYVHDSAVDIGMALHNDAVARTSKTNTSNEEDSEGEEGNANTSASNVNGETGSNTNTNANTSQQN